MITRRDFLKYTAAGGALASIGNISQAQNTIKGVIPNSDLCAQSARNIPVVAETDVIVVGGSSRAIAAASAAARTGAKVYVVTNMTYFGDDLCGSMLYEQLPDEVLHTPLSVKVFLDSNFPTPLSIKTVLENELIDNDIPFLYGSFVTDILVDEDNNPAGVVIANRNGRQAIKAKRIIDATHTASVARMAGAELTPSTDESQEFCFTVVGNNPKSSSEIVRSEVLSKPLSCYGKEYPVTRYTFSMPMKDGAYDDLMRAEQKARSVVWDTEQVDSSDLLWYIPNRTIVTKTYFKGNADSVRNIDISAFEPKDINNIWVLGPSAGIDRKLAAYVMRPIQAMLLGEIIGDRVGKDASSGSVKGTVKVKTTSSVGDNYGKICELLQPYRPSYDHGYVTSGSTDLPILGSYDVVVLGGGTAGASAGISAAQNGASTIVLESLHALGGLSTVGMIGIYWDGFKEGYTKRMNQEVTAMAPADHPRQLNNPEIQCPSDWKMEWLRKQYLDAGGNLWFGVLGCGALKEGNKIKGVVVATPYGRGVILSKVLIDSTGSADVPIAAGAAFETTGENVAVQGAGLGVRFLGSHYVNNDWLFVDDADVLDVTRAFVQAKTKFKNEYDIVKMPQTRERRRIVGEYSVSVCDVINKRRYPDTISFHKSSFDTHGMIVDPYFMLAPPQERHVIYDADVPLRSLLPKGLDSVIVTGLGASADRDAMPVIRMQPCLQNQGYSVGYLAATCVKDNVPIRKVDIKKVQKYLVKIGNLPERVLTDTEFKGFLSSEMEKAASTIGNNYEGLEILLSDKKKGIKAVRRELRGVVSPEAKLNLASFLCMLGYDEEADALVEAINNYQIWDKGWHYTGSGQFGMSASRLDALITALGHSKHKGTVDVVLNKANLLKPEDYFSHFRAISMALEDMADPRSAETLAAMLCEPGVMHHSISDIKDARSSTVPGTHDTSTRNIALKELHLARALFVSGDKDKMGENVLKRYADGMQAHYARYASNALAKKK